MYATHHRPLPKTTTVLFKKHTHTQNSALPPLCLACAGLPLFKKKPTGLSPPLCLARAGLPIPPFCLWCVCRVPLRSLACTGRPPGAFRGVVYVPIPVPVPPTAHRPPFVPLAVGGRMAKCTSAHKRPRFWAHPAPSSDMGLLFMYRYGRGALGALPVCGLFQARRLVP